MSKEYDLVGVKVKFLTAQKGPDIKTKNAGGSPMWGCNAEFKDETGQTKKHAIWSFEEIRPDMIGKVWTGSFSHYQGQFTDPKTGQKKDYIGRTFYPDKEVPSEAPVKKAEKAVINQETRGADHPKDTYVKAMGRYVNWLWTVCKGDGRSDEAAAAIFPGVRMMAGDYTPMFDLMLKDAAAEKAGMPNPTEATKAAAEKPQGEGVQEDEQHIPF